MRWSCTLLLVAAACGSKGEPPGPAHAVDPAVARAELPAGAAPADRGGPPPGPPVFPEGTRSLQLQRTAPVRLEPAADAKRIGTVAVDTRVAWTRTTAGKGCKQPWVELVPRGWVCGENFAPSTKPPYGREVPMLDRGKVVPGDYGKVTGKEAVTYKLNPGKSPAKSGPVTSPGQLAAAAGTVVEDKPVHGSLTVRIYEELMVAGKRYLRISPRDKELVLASAVKTLAPSAYAGARLGDDTGRSLPLAFVWPRNGGKRAWTHRQPNRSTNRQIDARTPVSIVETAAAADGTPTAYRIGTDEWIAPADVRVFQPAPPPPLLLPGERWIDIDLDAQILVAFEGELPVYATMISSGTKDHATTTGLYRVWLKESESDMKNLKSEDPYSVATVPWTQFFYPDEDLALHTAYWHDGFGKPRSRGCINLAPRDARWLYYWSDPQVPPGWTMTTGVTEAPGSIVRVRSAADPNPTWKGYAKKVAEVRQANAPAR